MNKSSYKANITKAYIYRFLSQFSFLTGVLIPFYTIWGGLSFVQVMIVQAIFTISVFLLEIPTGIVADKFGRRTSLFLGGVVGIIAFLVYASYPSFWIFALAEFILAISVALISGADQAMVYDSLREIKKEKGSKKVFSRLYSTAIIAIMIAAPIGGLIAQRFGLRAVMFAMTIPMIATALVALTFAEPKIGRKIARKESYAKILTKGLHHLKNHQILRKIVRDYILISVLAHFLLFVYQVKLQTLNVEIGAFGFVYTGIGLVQVIVLSSFHKLEKKLGGKTKYLLFSAMVTGIGMIILALANSVYVAIGGMLLAGAFGLSRKPLFHNYFNKHIKSRERATTLSIISMLFSISTAIIYVILGYLVDMNLTYTLVGVGVLIMVFGVSSKIKEKHLID